MVKVIHSSRIKGEVLSAPRINKVLVTGGGGFIGSALLPMLLQNGYKVRILDLLMYGLEPIKPWLDHPGLEIVQSDIRHRGVVREAMHDADAVVHLGAIVGDPACDLDENLALEINLTATNTLASLARESRVEHFIFASTCSVYGASDVMLDELSSIQPVSVYARTKAAAESTLISLADERFSPVILRFATIYGLSGRFRFDLVVNLLTAKAMLDNVITVYGGNQWRAFVHVADAARSIIRVLGAPAQTVRGEIFNVGSTGQNYTIEDIGNIIKNMIPQASIVRTGDLIDPQNYRVNCDKIQQALNYYPQWTIEQGVEQVRQVIQEGQVKDYKEARYSNVKFLSCGGLSLLEKS